MRRRSMVVKLQGTPLRLRQEDEVAIRRLMKARKLPAESFRGTVHEAIAAGVRAIDGDWEARLKKAEQRVEVLEAVLEFRKGVKG